MIACQAGLYNTVNCHAENRCDNCKAKILLGELIAFTKAIAVLLPDDQATDAIEVWRAYKAAAVQLGVAP